ARGVVSETTSPVLESGALNVRAFSLASNVDQSVFDSFPVWVASATGRLKVCVAVAEEIAKSVPAVPVANVCADAVSPLIESIPPDPVASNSWTLENVNGEAMEPPENVRS